MSYGEMRYYVHDKIPTVRICDAPELKDSDICGAYIDSQKTILISQGMTYTQKRCALVHELIHWIHGDDQDLIRTEKRTRKETANILIQPSILRVEESMYETDYAQIAEDMDVTESVLADYLKSCGVTIQTAKTN